ncbi:hypothetical protein CLU79DRAFT_830299 [Phycomyces nitens]|nr:hypothetical protein CLU79DRAFT_830299 [Phycomyces nitens]
MSILNLPLELMHIIADLLSPKAKFQCVQVCTTWQAVFEQSLWETIVIKSPECLKEVCNVATTRTNRYHKTGYRTRRLYLGDSIGIGNNQLYTLQKSFPNLKHLIISKSSLKNSHNITRRGWIFWRGLTELKLYINELGSQSQVQTLRRLSSYLPNIKRLECCSNTNSKAPIYTLEDFEAFHSNMPGLEYLCLSVNVAVLSDHDIELILNAEPAQSIICVKLQITTIDIRWLCYFAKKYPNLSTLHWVEVEPFYGDYAFAKEATDILEQISRMFIHLNKFYINMSLKSEKLFSILCEALHKNDQLLEKD